MSQNPVPDYEEWRRYCFSLGYADFMSRDDAVASARADRFAQIPARTALAYLARCFSESASLRDEFTSDCIGEGVQYIFGCASEYFSTFREDRAVSAAVAACYRAVATLYRDCFDRACCRGATDPDGDYIGLRSAEGGASDQLDGAVYMIWDMDQIDPVLWFPDEYPVLFDASVEVLRDILKHCRTSTCKISALHGVGHVHESRRDLAARLVDEFLKRPGQPRWVFEYARQAREGGVQ